jgi:hypothetical protein
VVRQTVRSISSTRAKGIAGNGADNEGEAHALLRGERLLQDDRRKERDHQRHHSRKQRTCTLPAESASALPDVVCVSLPQFLGNFLPSNQMWLHVDLGHALTLSLALGHRRAAS